MKIINILILSLWFLSGSAIAEIILDEKKINEIRAEITQSVKDSDFSVIEKYMYPGSEIILDFDPAADKGETEIDYDDFMELAEFSLQMMEGAEIHDELIALEIDKSNNQATVEEKTTIVMEMMGIKIEDISISTTTYGIVDGEIKVLYTKDRLISSGSID